jgi:hypothetical protein
LWRWSLTGAYSSASSYDALFISQTTLHGAKELWKVQAPNSCRFFIWVVLHSRCWTSHRLQQHGLQNNGPCALCGQADETLDHLLAQCVVARETWFKVLRPLGWQQLTPSPNVDMVEWWLRSRKVVAKAHWKAFDSLVFLVVWSLWLECNSRVFNQKTSSMVALISCILSRAKLWCRAGFVNRSAMLGE